MGGKLLLLPAGGLTDVSRIVRKRSKACRKKSAEAIVPAEKKEGKKQGRAEQSNVLSKRRKGIRNDDSRKPRSGLPAKR